MNTYTKRFIKSHIVEIILSIPKSVYFNFKILKWRDACKFPFAVSHNIKLEGVTRNNFIVESKSLTPFSMRIGFGDSASGIRESKKGLIQIGKRGIIRLKGIVGLSQGIVLVSDEGFIELGDNFRCNYSTTIDSSQANIIIGDNVVCGWHVTIKNNDGHYIVEKGSMKQQSGDIVIGDHIWLCAESTILKNVTIENDSVIAYASVVTKGSGMKGSLYAGQPAKVVKKEINWIE